MRGDVPAETRLRARARTQAGGALVAACVRKQSRVRATTGPRSKLSALGAEEARLSECRVCADQQHRREWCNSIGAQANGSPLDNAANRRAARLEAVLGGSARPESGAEHPHPRDLSVSLGVVRLLLDHKRSLRVADVEAIGDTLAIGKGVRIERYELLDLVGILEPVPQHDL